MQTSLEAHIIKATEQGKGLHERKFPNDQRQELWSCSGKFNKRKQKDTTVGLGISFLLVP